MLVRNVNTENCKRFLKRYPSVRALILKPYKGKNMLKQYCAFLTARDKAEAEIAVTDNVASHVIDSPTFGVKRFYDWEWNGLTGWAELFQYVKTNKNL